MNTTCTAIVTFLLAITSTLHADQKINAIRGAKILNPAGTGWLEDRVVQIFDGRIAAIDTAATQPVQPGESTINAAGLMLIPGLIDLHSHLLLHPYNEATWNDQVLKESLELRTIRGVVAARNTLEAGFTMLRDLGTEGAGFADVALRDAIAQQMIPGPRLFVATRAIVARGCYGPAGFDSRWDIPQGAQEINGTDSARAAVREQIAAGADWIKVYADYRRGRDAQATPTLSQAELDAIVDESRSAGRKVSAHAGTDAGIARAIQAGVSTIEHGYGATDQTLIKMNAAGIVLCPTLAAAEAVARYAGWDGNEPAPPRVIESRASFSRALAAGVTIANGSDVGVFPHGDNIRELELMTRAGMTPTRALQAATTTAAAVLGRERTEGRIDVGFAADLVLVRGDPLGDIRALRNVVMVLQRGTIVLDRR